jgi:hypothetical protein
MGMRNVLVLVRGKFEDVYRKIAGVSYKPSKSIGGNYIEVPEEAMIKPKPADIPKETMKSILQDYPVKEIIQIDPESVILYTNGNNNNAQKIVDRINRLYAPDLQAEAIIAPGMDPDLVLKSRVGT